MPTLPHISVCICTYLRPVWLRRLLLAVDKQQTGGLFEFSIVVADNDASGSARETVEAFERNASTPVTYCIEPAKNIALVRNRSVAAATGDWIAFIDDDEFPIDEWLLHLYRTCIYHQVQGVLGPVKAHYEVTPPQWVEKCAFFNHRREHLTGYVMPWRDTRTGNVLFRRDILIPGEPPFDAMFPNGGEDQDFFRRLMARGHRFIWCNEAVVHETVPPIRWDKRVLIRRALLRGRNSLKQSRGFSLGVFKSALIIPIYLLALPFLALIGKHVYMHYLIKLCDHLGKVLAAFGLNWVRERAG